MSSYDPRRSRPRPVAAPDPEAAPIEALFGPEPEPDPSTELVEAKASTAPSVTAESRRPVPTPRSSAPSPLWQLAPLLAVLGVLGALVWWLTRRRQR